RSLPPTRRSPRSSCTGDDTMRLPFLAIAAALVLGACIADDDSTDAQESTELGFRYPNPKAIQLTKIAWLGNDPSNTYDNASLAGATDVAEDRLAHITPFYSEFDPAAQLSQCMTAVNSRVDRSNSE